MRRILLSILVIGILLLSACGAPATGPETETPSTPTTEQPTPAACTLSITVSPSGAGSVLPSGGQYEEGSQVTLTATPASGYTFDYWDGNASGSSATITIIMDSDKDVIATFTRISYDLSINIVGNGTTSPEAGVHSYPEGTVVKLNATPDEGWEFSGWSGDITDTSATSQITMDSNRSVIAHFKVTEPEPIEFSGHGDDVSPEFILEGGITIITITHDGRSNFAIWLYDIGTGERVDLLVNEIGPFSGSAVIGVTGEIFGASPGRHLLDITADGNWKVTIEQPRPTTAPTAPQTFTGRGCSVSPPFMLEMGIARFEMTHDGRSNFAVWLYDKDGYQIDLLVNEIGAYSGSKVVGVTGKIFDASPGIHYLAITADGNWTVSISQ